MYKVPGSANRMHRRPRREKGDRMGNPEKKRKPYNAWSHDGATTKTPSKMATKRQHGK